MLILLASIFYFMPLLGGMWALRNAISRENGDAGLVYWSQVRRWLLLEQNILFGQISTGIGFLLFAYSSRLNSFWNANKPRYRVIGNKHVVVDVWLERKHQDYLGYLKFEFIQYSYFGSLFFSGILVMPYFDKFIQYPKYVE